MTPFEAITLMLSFGMLIAVLIHKKE
ncbi:putative holin-like toxin [Halobacillus seohaensis]|uniref:Holin-like toxin n=1 Tax=Halobacillus seohaensis TaxID=447421 RepID=A0ABW2ELD7_9BACI